MNTSDAIDVSVPPSGAGCADCEATLNWWLHLRRCAECGHVGCCDDSLAKHATAHFEATGHPVMQSFEPGETWMWNYLTNDYVEGPALAPPLHHPIGQPTPGPAGRVPANWEQLLA